MKKLGIASATLCAALAFVPAYAVNVQNQFPVNITLTSACLITTAPGPVSFAYTSGQAGVATATGTTANVTCTNTLPYTVSLATVAGAPLTGNGYNVTDAATGLAYTLTLNGAAVDLTGQKGTGVAQTITIGGTMAGGQYGTCAAASCTNAGSANLTQTLTITY